jgi:tetratricopeptide (TPR) repeat protein
MKGPFFMSKPANLFIAVVLAFSFSFSGAFADTATSDMYYIKGRQRVLDGRYEEALPLLEKALKADPDNHYINYQMSEVYLRLGNYERAEGLARKALEKEPKNLEYLATLGGILASLKKYPEAKDYYQKILDLEPTNQKVALLLGLLEAESGNMEQGIKTLSRAVDENSENYMALFYRAKIYIEMEQVDKAKKDLERVLTLRPTLVEAGTALGLIHERLNENDEAIKTYERIEGSGRFKKRLAQLYLGKNELEKALSQLLDYEKEEPDDYTARVKIGLIYFEQKEWEKARTTFIGILKEQTDADNVRFYLGAVYEELKQKDKAIAEFRKVSKDSTFYKEAMIHVGFIYKELGRLKEGLKFAQGLAIKNPDVVEFIDLHASYYELQKDFRKAITIVQDGLKKHQSDERLLYFEGALFDKMGERRKGIDSMKKILVLNPNNAHALNFLGYVYSEMEENLDEAEAYVTKALQLKPDDGYIEDSLGWILFKKGKTDDAIARLEKAHKMQPEEAIILEHLGDAYSKKGDTDKATDMYKKAVALVHKKDKVMSKKIENKIAIIDKEKRNPSNAAQ